MSAAAGQCSDAFLRAPLRNATLTFIPPPLYTSLPSLGFVSSQTSHSPMCTQMKSSWLVAGLSLISFLPYVRAASCWIDSNGFEHCSLSDGARVGIAIAIIVVALLFIVSAFGYKRRRQGRAFVVNQAPGPVNNQNVAYGPGSYPAGYNGQSPYYQNGQQYPPQQYSPQPYGGYNQENTFAPPPGPPPPAYYAPPQGPPPAVLKSDV